MKKIKFESHNQIEMAEVAEIITNYFQNEKLITFTGDLGAGKTTLISMICKELGSVDDVSSPTYSLVNEYKTNKGETIYHIDCYRINSIEEAIDAGIEDVMYSDAFCFIEWPSKIKTLLENRNMVKVDIQVNGAKRLISMELVNNSEVLSR